ncbi:MAG: DUF5721 family protein [Lachnospiraceae bacterium]|nr:DUF5721 family protein [Lachnospiraceae bacterium]
MLAVSIKDIKQFMREMFVGELFDNFLLVKANINHDINYEIDGHLNSDFFDSEEKENMLKDSYKQWSQLKSLITTMIKGNKLPLNFNIVLTTSKKSLEILFNSSSHDFTIDQVEGLFINIIYKNEELLITSGSSYSVFSMDKSLDNAFENAIKRLLASKSIDFEE